MKATKVIGVATAASIALLGSPNVASAQTPPPPPEPGCQGVQLIDKRGDSAQTSTDILNIFYLTSGGKTTANLQVRDLKTELPEGSTQWFWYMNYLASDGNTYRLIAYLKGDGTSGFKARRRVFYNEDTGRALYVDVGAVTGKVFPGKDGVVQWELTDAIGGAAGSKLTEHFAAADEVTAGEPFMGTPYLRVVASIDDTTDVKSTEYVVRECGADEAPSTGTRPTAPAPPEPTQPTQPGETKSEPEQSGSPAAKRGASCKAKAKKIKNKKKRAKAMKKCKKKKR